MATSTFTQLLTSEPAWTGGRILLQQSSQNMQWWVDVKEIEPNDAAITRLCTTTAMLDGPYLK